MGTNSKISSSWLKDISFPTCRILYLPTFGWVFWSHQCAHELFSFLTKTNFIWFRHIKKGRKKQNIKQLFWKYVPSSSKLFLLYTDSSFISFLNSKDIRLQLLSETPSVTCDARKYRTKEVLCKYEYSMDWMLTGHCLGSHMLTINFFLYVTNMIISKN